MEVTFSRSCVCPDGSTSQWWPAVAEVRWLPQALRDLRAIGVYFDTVAPARSRRVIQRLYAVQTQLAAFPESGRVVPEMALPFVREIIREGYRVVYSCHGEAVEILAVLDSRQDLERKLRQEA